MTTYQPASNHGEFMGYFEDFQVALSNQDSPALLRLWEEYTNLEELDPQDFLSILEAVKQSDLREFIGRHIDRIVPLWQKMPESAAKNETLKLIIDLQMVNPDFLRDLAFELLEQLYANTPHHQEKMRLIGLRGKNEPFKGAISNYELLSHLKKGEFVFHTGGWGVGEVVDVSFVREQASFEFDFVPGKKEISFRNAFNCLLPIPTHHFLALRFGSPDLLEEQARKDPVEVIRLLLRDLGPKTAAEIKDELCELVIPADEWVKWWQSARSKLKKDTFIQTPSDLNAPFRLHRKEISHEERLHKSFEQKPDADTLIQMVYSFLKDFPETVKNPAFKQTLEGKLQEALSFAEISPAQKLQILFFLKDLSGEKEMQAVRELISSIDAADLLIQTILIHSFKKRAATEIRKTRDDWKEIFLKLLFTVEQALVRDYLLSELLANNQEKELKKQLDELSAHPTRYPEACIWYFQRIIDDPSLPYGDKEGRSRFFEAFLILLSTLENSSGHRDLIKKMHSILLDGRYSIVRKIFKDATIKDVQEFLLLASKCQSLSDHDLKIFHSLAEVAHPSIAKKKKREEEIEIIWTTAAGYQKLQKRIEQVGTVETVENAKEIEIARSHGDLRENAEFKAALEKRDRLQSELSTLSAQLNKSRILTPADIHTAQVSVGTIVDCESKSGEKTSFTLLGPWDADPEKGILSFQSKVAKSLLNLKVGDSCEIQGVLYKIVAIRSAL